MNRDDITRMARSAGCHDNGEEFRFVEFRYLERFAALVAAAERDGCAQVFEQFEEDMGHGIPQRCADAIRARGQDPMPLFDDWPGGFK